MSEWIIDGKRSRLRNHRVLECGRRVHADGLREDVMTRCTDQWREWWDYLTDADILVCCWYVARYGSRTWRKRWKDWLPDADQFLWSSVTLGACPFPPRLSKRGEVVL